MKVYFIRNGHIACGEIVGECEGGMSVLIQVGDQSYSIEKTEIFFFEDAAKKHHEKLMMQYHMERWLDDACEVLFEDHNISEEIRVTSSPFTAYIKPAQGGYDIEFRKHR